MDGFIFYCKLWGTEKCSPDIRHLKFFKEKKPGEKIPLWPVGEELRKLDQICKKCEFRLFEIKEKKCLLCGNKDIQWERAKKIEYQFGFIEGNFYRCDKCNTELIAQKKFNYETY